MNDQLQRLKFVKYFVQEKKNSAIEEGDKKHKSQ